MRGEGSARIRIEQTFWAETAALFCFRPSGGEGGERQNRNRVALLGTFGQELLLYSVFDWLWVLAWLCGPGERHNRNRVDSWAFLNRNCYSVLFSTGSGGGGERQNRNRVALLYSILFLTGFGGSGPRLGVRGGEEGSAVDRQRAGALLIRPWQLRRSGWQFARYQTQVAKRKAAQEFKLPRLPPNSPAHTT